MPTHLYIVPLELAEANALVAKFHRHHFPVVGHRFSIGCADADGVLHGAAIVGRPVARKVNHRTCVEVTRLVTDGTPHACSLLYAAAARVARELGYSRIQTYILDTEPGTSLRAAGWQLEGVAGGGDWSNNGTRERRRDQPETRKGRWARTLRTDVPAVVYPVPAETNGQATLFNLLLETPVDDRRERAIE